MKQRLHVRTARAASVALLACAALTGGCSLWGPSHADSPPAASSSTELPGTSLGHISDNDSHAATPPGASSSRASQATQAEPAICADLRAQIRTAQENARQAPTTSTSQVIVAARLAKADQTLDALRSQYDQLGCSSAQAPATHERIAQPPAAPGNLPP